MTEYPCVPRVPVWCTCTLVIIGNRQAAGTTWLPVVRVSNLWNCSFFYSRFFNYVLCALSLCRVLLEMLSPSASQKIPPQFCETRNVIAASTEVPSRARPEESTPSQDFFKVPCNIIFPSTPRSLNWSLSQRFSSHNPANASPFAHSCYMSSLSHSS